MKVTVFDIKRFAVHDGPGIRTTLFMKGCPLHCWWCHNPESQSADPVTVKVDRKLNGKSIQAFRTYGESMEVEEVVQILLRDRHFYEESGGGVTFSGGEPLMQAGALVSLLKACREKGLHTTIDTSGFAPRELIGQVIAHTNLFLYDLKNMAVGLHKKYTGFDNDLILSNADFLLEKGAKVIFRIPVIPGVNTSDKELGLFFAHLEERKEKLEEIHLLPYHRIAENKYRRLGITQKLPDIEPPDPEYMEEIRKQFEETGLRVTIGG